MIQCQSCEFFRRGADGAPRLSCDPFSTIKEPECLLKWNFVKLEAMVRSYEATLEMYRRLAPMQEKMFRHIEREINDIDAADDWKSGYDESEEDEEDDRFR